MSTSAVIMMIIGCTGLWGGCALAVVTAMKHNRKKSLSDAGSPAGGKEE